MPTRPALHCSMERRLTTAMVDDGALLHDQSDDGGILWPGAFRGWPGLSLPEGGIGTTSPALTGHPSGRRLQLFVRAAGGNRAGRILTARSDDYGRGWSAWESAAISPDVRIEGSPAAAADGDWVHLAGRRADRRCLVARSANGGGSFGTFEPLGSGVFETSFAVATGEAGRTVIVVGRGTDDRFWFARSRDHGGTWELAWDAIGPGTFRSAPGAALTSDLSLLVVAGQGMDHRIWWNRSTDLGTTWQGWQPTHPTGRPFLTGPSVTTDWNGSRVWMVSVLDTGRVVVAGSKDQARSWAFGWHLVDAHDFREGA